MSTTIKDSQYWTIKLSEHYSNFYPELMDEMRGDPQNEHRVLFNDRVNQAENTFNELIKTMSIESAMELANQDLTVDLPTPVYGPVVRQLNVIDGGEKLMNDEIISLCKAIRKRYPSIKVDMITPSLVSQTLIALTA